ncbi:MAG: collagen binding domain-containing protein [Blautia obeum]
MYDLDAKVCGTGNDLSNTAVHKSYFTDENGYLILPESLKCGNYRIEEVRAPDGYTQNTQYVEIKVDKNTAYQMDSVSGDAIITVTYENHPVRGKLVIHKSGETLNPLKGFCIRRSFLEGAEFKEIYAAEDIFTGSSGGRAGKPSRDLCKGYPGKNSDH